MFDWSYWGYGSAIALIAWLPFGLWRFSRVRPTLAAAQVMLWGMMWLPEGAAFDLPGLPPFSKYTISAVCVLLGLWWKAPERLRAARVGRGLDLMVGLLLLAQLGTVITNPDALHYGTYRAVDLPGFTAYDGISAAVRVLLTIGLPFVLGRALLRSERDLNDLLETLAVAGVVYSLPILYELRMAPVLHDTIYGYSPRTDWLQNLRGGGYRPTVFMGHGLVVGFFMFLSTMAAVTLHKAGRKRLLGQPILWVIGYLWVILLLCKAAAPIIYAAVGFALVQYLSSSVQARVLALLGLVVLSYPLTRILDLFPVSGLLSLAGGLGPERVQSLQFRFDNEDILLLKGVERLWFGWGGYGRDRVYSLETGKDLVIQDGQWIVVFGQSGLVGFLGYFALLLLPVWQLARALPRVIGRAQRAALAGFGFMVVACAVNMLPNMQLPYLQFVLASGLSVLLGGLARAGSRATAPSARAARRASVRASRGAPLRPVWYGTPPPGAYVSDAAPRGAVELGVSDPGVLAARRQRLRPANDVADEPSDSVQTLVIRSVSERPGILPPAPEAGADLSTPDLALPERAPRAVVEPTRETLPPPAPSSQVIMAQPTAASGRAPAGIRAAAANERTAARLEASGRGGEAPALSVPPPAAHAGKAPVSKPLPAPALGAGSPRSNGGPRTASAKPGASWKAPVLAPPPRAAGRSAAKPPESRQVAAAPQAEQPSAAAQPQADMAGRVAASPAVSPLLPSQRPQASAAPAPSKPPQVASAAAAASVTPAQVASAAAPAPHASYAPPIDPAAASVAAAIARFSGNRAASRAPSAAPAAAPSVSTPEAEPSVASTGTIKKPIPANDVTAASSGEPGARHSVPPPPPRAAAS